MPPMRRRGGIVRTVGRTAAVAGTASAVSGRVSRRQNAQQLAAQEQQAAAPQPPPQQSAVPPPAASPEPAADDPIARLQQLGDMKAQGLLSDDEFAAAKAKLLSP